MVFIGWDCINFLPSAEVMNSVNAQVGLILIIFVLCKNTHTHTNAQLS